MYGFQYFFFKFENIWVVILKQTSIEKVICEEILLFFFLHLGDRIDKQSLLTEKNDFVY